MIVLVFITIAFGVGNFIALAENNSIANKIKSDIKFLGARPDIILLDYLTPVDFEYGFIEWNLPGPECRIGDKWQGKEKLYILTFIKIIDGLVYAAWVPVESVE